jgi:hypothetical protein
MRKRQPWVIFQRTAGQNNSSTWTGCCRARSLCSGIRSWTV